MNYASSFRNIQCILQFFFMNVNLNQVCDTIVSICVFKKLLSNNTPILAPIFKVIFLAKLFKDNKLRMQTILKWFYLET